MELETTKFGKIGKSEEILKADVIKTAIDTLESSKPLDKQEYDTPTTLNGLITLTTSIIEKLGGKFVPSSYEVEYVVNGITDSYAYFTIPSLSIPSGGKIETFKLMWTSNFGDDFGYPIKSENGNVFKLVGYSNIAAYIGDGEIYGNMVSEDGTVMVKINTLLNFVTSNNDSDTLTESKVTILPTSSFAGLEVYPSYTWAGVVRFYGLKVVDADGNATMNLVPMSTADGIGFIRDTVSGTDYYSITDTALVPGPAVS